MKTIQAKVNTRLLSKASRLFTGTLAGRVIEILQNARRARARHVEITNQDGLVTVRDDGRGIRDFEKLLDLGGSGWEETLEASEDPAGVGLFCLAPRELTVRSRGMKMTVSAEGWTGAPVEIQDDPQKLPKCPSGIPADAGTEICFKDEPWTSVAVDSLAAFSGMEVTVDAEPCPKVRFIRGQSTHYLQLGCRVKVIREDERTDWHRTAPLDRSFDDNCLLNFHGQVVSFAYHPASHHSLHFLVDMTSQPTGIRLMLPARTCPVENDAFKQLKAVLELEAFKYLQRQGQHRLPFKEYLRARELGIELPEAQECFHVGLLRQDIGPEPVEVTMPKGHSLKQCYRLAEKKNGHESDEANVHLLAALGAHEQPFVPVDIHSEYDAYSWAKLPTIGRVEVQAGKVMQESWVGSGQLICVDSLWVKASCSDGKTFRSIVCMAIRPPQKRKQPRWFDECEVCITPQAQHRLGYPDIWFHLGGYSEDGDTYDTQEYDFGQQLSAFWMRLTGPDEPIRYKLMECLADLSQDWQSVLIQSDGKVTICQADGTEKLILPPEAASAEEVSS